MLFQNMFDSSVLASTERCENHYSLFSSTPRDLWSDQPRAPSRQSSFSSNSTDSPPMSHRALSRENSCTFSMPEFGPHVPSAPSSTANVKNLLLYKTELCRSYEESGTCRYSEKCQFAHGVAQLRDVPRHPKYKTQICRTYWEQGSCPYGKRCCFIHTAVESSTAQWNIQHKSARPSPSMMPIQKPADSREHLHARAAFVDGMDLHSIKPTRNIILDGSYSPASPQAKPRVNSVRDNVREDLAGFFWASSIGKQGRLQVFQNFS